MLSYVVTSSLFHDFLILFESIEYLLIPQRPEGVLDLWIRHGRGNMAPFYRLSRVWSSDKQIGNRPTWLLLQQNRDASNDVCSHFFSLYPAVSWQMTQMTRAKMKDFPRSFKTAPSFVLIAVLQKQWLSSMALQVFHIFWFLHVLELYFYVFLSCRLHWVSQLLRDRNLAEEIVCCPHSISCFADDFPSNEL